MDEEKRCEICGAKGNESFYFFGKPGHHYCSESCAYIDGRKVNLVATIIFFIISLIPFIMITILEFSYIILSIILSFIFLIFTLMVLRATIIGFKKYQEMIKPISDESEMSEIENIRYKGFSEKFSEPKIHSSKKDSLKCAICKMKLKKSEEYYQCIFCLSVFHTKHLTAWLSVKNECPVCKSTI